MTTRRRGIRIVVVCLVGSLGLLGMACASWRIWSVHDLWVYRQLRSHTPVAQSLWTGGIRPGSRIADVMARVQPHRVDDLGPFRQIYYHPRGPLPPGSFSNEGTWLLAHKGRLIWAESAGCTFQRTYFDIATPAEMDQYTRFTHKRAEARQAARP